VTVSVVCSGNLISEPGGPCSVVVEDLQPPMVTATNVCTYPVGDRKYSKKRHCFDVTQLAVLKDDCPLGTTLSLVECQLAGPLLSKSLVKKAGAGCSISDTANFFASHWLAFIPRGLALSV